MDDVKSHLYALIFCGGGGTRLWPFSRQKRPKQFLKIKSKKTLIRETFERLLPLIPVEHIYIVTIPEYTDEVAEELPEVPKKQVLVEPARRNTAMAAGLGAVAIRKEDPQAIIANIWSDHLIENEAGYRKSLLAAAKAAADGENLVTTGLPPTYPHTGLGYVKKGRVHDVIDSVDVFKVEKFTEKPKLPEAKRIFKSGAYLWHVGLLVWRVDAFMDGIKKHSPGTAKRLEAISEAMEGNHGKGKIIKEYESAPDVSIDVALAEKATNFLIVQGKFDWYDLGDFSVLWKVLKKDKNDNAVILDEGGEWVGIETTDSMVISEGKRTVGLIGLTDMIVVAVDDAVLVAPKKEAQKVKKIVNQLKEEKKTDFL
jgi:mannose-1-phosphate guanylyltransferase